MWREKLGLDDEVKPVWMVLYNHQLKNAQVIFSGEFLHGAVAVNAFVSVINPNISSDCPFCKMRERQFFIVFRMLRLCDLFCFLDVLFVSLGVFFFRNVYSWP